MTDFFINDSTDPAFNLALEEVLARLAPGRVFMLWRNANAVIVGRNQVTLGEINSDYISENNIKVIRRMTGGGAVYHDLGNINFTYVSERDAKIPPNFGEFAKPVLEVLRSLNVPAEFSGRNDIVANGRKISGCAQSVMEGRILFHGTLLFNTNLEVLVNALKVDPTKIVSKRIESVRSRVANISEFVDEKMTSQDFIKLLAAKLSASMTTRPPCKVPFNYITETVKLARTKYDLDSWNYGASPAFDYVKSHRFPSGGVTLSLNIAENRIRKAHISGDFFGTKDTFELTDALENIALDAIKSVLDNFDITCYISGVTNNELYKLFPEQKNK